MAAQARQLAQAAEMGAAQERRRALAVVRALRQVQVQEPPRAPE
jgi:hypothetical protein